MNGQYQRFKNFHFYEELTEHFLLTATELEIVRSCRGNAHRQGMAILLKGLEYLGYFPENLQQVTNPFRDADVSGLDVSGFSWDREDFNDCNLRNANLSDCSFSGSDFRGADLCSQIVFGIGVSPCAEVELISSCGFVSGIKETKKVSPPTAIAAKVKKPVV